MTTFYNFPTIAGTPRVNCEFRINLRRLRHGFKVASFGLGLSFLELVRPRQTWRGTLEFPLLLLVLVLVLLQGSLIIPVRI